MRKLFFGIGLLVIFFYFYSPTSVRQEAFCSCFNARATLMKGALDDRTPASYGMDFDYPLTLWAEVIDEWMSKIPEKANSCAISESESEVVKCRNFMIVYPDRKF